MLCLLSPLGLSSGYGLSPSSCLLPHMSPTASSFAEHDELLGSRNLGDPATALLKAPMQKLMQNASTMPANVSPTARRASVTMRMPTGRMTRRGALLGATSLAAAALPLAGLPRAAEAADLVAMEMVEQVGSLSMQARALQFAMREAAAPAGRTDDALRALVARDRPLLEQLATAMTTAAPSLRLCAPGAEDCECVSDPARMRAAARYAAAASARVGALDAALSAPGGFTGLQDGTAFYEGGRVELELEMLCEASDAFLDLVAGRPTNPMADRLAPVGAPAAAPALAPALLVPRRSPVQAAADERAPKLA